MKKADLIAAVAEQTELSRAKASEVVDAVLSAIEGALKKQDEVRLVGFGTFAAAPRKAGKDRNKLAGFVLREKAGSRNSAAAHIMPAPKGPRTVSHRKIQAAVEKVLLDRSRTDA